MDLENRVVAALKHLHQSYGDVPLVELYVVATGERKYFIGSLRQQIVEAFRNYDIPLQENGDEIAINKETRELLLKHIEVVIKE